MQKYRCQNIADGSVTISFATELKSLPENALDRVPFLQMQPEGTVVFDTQTGRM